jgi:hypothetical protein
VIVRRAISHVFLAILRHEEMLAVNRGRRDHCRP